MSDVPLKYKHCCGRQGFGWGTADYCPACQPEKATWVDKQAAGEAAPEITEAMVERLAKVIRQAEMIMAAWSNGVGPDGVELGKECPRCPSPCSVYGDWQIEAAGVRAALEARKEEE